MKFEKNLNENQNLPLADEATEEKYLKLLEDFAYGAGKGLAEDKVIELEGQLAEIQKKYRFSDDFTKKVQMTIERLKNE